MAITVELATSDRWPDVVAAFGRGGMKPDSCWCQRFRRHDAPSNKVELQHEINAAKVPVGLVAYVDGLPAGWSRVVPRHSLPGVVENRALQRILAPDDSAWWVSCFAIRKEFRGLGVGITLLSAAVDHARAHHASVLDGHPVDVARLRGHASPSALFTGVLPTFLAAGFVEIGRTYPSRPVMRIRP